MNSPIPTERDAALVTWEAVIHESEELALLGEQKDKQIIAAARTAKWRKWLLISNGVGIIVDIILFIINNLG